MKYLLLATIFLPLAAAALLGALGKASAAAARWLALATGVATFVMAALLAARFPLDGAGDYQFVFHQPWVPPASGLDIAFSFGLDGVSLWLFGLTALLMITCVLVSWQAIADRAGLFYGMLLLLECGCLGVFAARDLIVFYIFFEFTLIPLFFLIGIWGSEQRGYAAVKFFLFTLAGSVFTFLGLLSLVLWHYFQQPSPERILTFSIPALTEAYATGELMPANIQWWVFLALFAGFAVKAPLFPLHTWLPLAHVEAPTAGSVYLAGILLKIGAYGLVRFSVPMLPDAAEALMPWLLWLCVAGILYGALVALAQSDIKRLIAYSSVSHLGFCLLGLFAYNRLGVQGGVLQMINHGISTGALFALVGMIYERWHTREIASVAGLAAQTPWLAFFFVFFTLSSIGLPGMNGFAGEFLALAGMFQRAWRDPPSAVAGQLQVISILAVSGVVLGAWYMLWLCQQVFFGKLKQPAAGDDHPIGDLNWREGLSLAPLAVFVLWIGVWPNFFLSRMAPALNQTIANVQPVSEHLAEVRPATFSPSSQRSRSR